MNHKSDTQHATFAGGCFWCIEAAFANFPGVVSAISGLTGGSTPNPTYDQVHANPSGHKEAVLVEYDPSMVTYQQLLEHFWRQIDPTDPDGQFADRGAEYTTAIYYHNDQQKQLAQQSKQSLEDSGKFNKPIATEILPATDFYPAEAYQQSYAVKHPLRYQLYKKGSGRADYIKKTLN